MHSAAWLRTPAAAGIGLGMLLGGLALACGPAPAPPTPTAPASDPFAVVRATSQAAYQAGRAALDQGDLIRGCPAIDTAKTTDPDNRPEIQAALDQCLTQIPQLLAATAPPAATPPQRPVVVATAPAPASSTALTPATNTQGATAATPRAGTTPVAGAATSTLGAGTPRAAGAATPTPAARSVSTTPAGGMVTLRDPQGRFSIGAPANWPSVEQPQTLFGTAVVQVRDPTARASLDVSVDNSAKAVSPELYAASIELAMQQQVPGYALEQIVPGTVSGNPAIRRVFTFTQHDASGQDHQARAFQTVVVKGQTPYILMGAAPADQFAEFSATLDQMVESFRFS